MTLPGPLAHLVPILERLPEAREILRGRRGLPCLISLALAWRALRRNQLEAAGRRIRYVVERQPRCGRAHLFLGQQLLRSGDRERAIRHLTLATESRLARRDALLALGHALLEQDSEAAVRCFRDAAAEAGSKHTVAAALALELDSQYGEALRAYERLLEVNPDEGAALRGLIRVVPEVHGAEGSLRWWAARLGWVAPNAANRPAKRTRGARPRDAGDRERVLVVSGNWSFAREMIDHLAQQPSADVRTLEVREAAAWTLGDVARGRLPWRWRSCLSTLASPEERDLIGQADVICAEWCNDTAVWLSRYGPARPRLVIRLLGYEALGPWPAVVDWRRVDALMFLSEHSRDSVHEVLDLGAFPHLASVVVPLVTPASRFHRPKTEEAWRTLGLIGWKTINKDALLAVRVLRALRRSDKRWRLRLLGRPPRPWTREQRAYVNELRDLIAGVESTAISLDPWTQDVPAWLTGVGYVLSTSRSESFHKAVAEGMASGAIPVVRRWPASQTWRGAERQYPNALLFDDPEDAAAQILELSADPDAVAGKASQAAREARERFDSDVVLPRLTAIILGTHGDVAGTGEPGAVRRQE